MKKRWISMLLCAATLLPLAACGSSDSNTQDTPDDTQSTEQAAGEPQYGGTLRVAVSAPCATPGYTPEMTNNAYLTYLSIAYESLTYYDEEGNIIPRLAESWETDPAEPSITWHLREGVQFADGTPFNAEAVKVNIEEYQKSNRNETADIVSCEVIDDYTIKMILTEWNSSAVEMIGFFVYYMSPDALQDVDTLRNSSCGTGAFQVSSFNPNAEVIYTKNENYWQEGKPYLDGVEVTIVNEPSTRASALQAGEYDIAMIGDLTLSQQFVNDSEYVMLVNENGQGVVGTGLIPNSAKEDSPFADAKVRQAMCYAIDEKALAETFGYGLLQTTNQWAVPGSITYSDDVQGYPYDPEKAKELLAEAGYPDGFDTTLTTNPTNKDIFTAAAAMLSEVGIRCEVNLVDESTNNALYASGDWDGIMGHFHAISPDLGLYMGRHLDVDGAYYAKGILHPDEAMDMLSKIRTATTDEEKIDLEHQMQVLIYDDLALFGKPLFVQCEPMFKHSYVHDDGFTVYHQSTSNLENCWLDK